VSVRNKYRGLRRTPSRDALLLAAEQLIGARGFDAVSIDEIVARAGVAKGTFYNHFDDKTGIAFELAKTIRAEVRDRIRPAAAATDPAMHLAIAQALFMNLAVTNPSRAHLLLTMLTGATDATNPMNAPLRATLQSGHATGHFAFPDLEAALTYVLGNVSIGMRAILESAPGGAVTAAREPFVANLIGHCLIGLGVAPGDAGVVAAGAVRDFFSRDFSDPSPAPKPGAAAPARS
jgi:AcrR family transcriptional regulator